MTESTRLLQRLLDEPRESTWLEFKTNLADVQVIGEYASALANSATLAGRSHGYLVWGVANESKEVVGTEVVPTALKKGNEDLEPWLARLLTPDVHIQFHSVPGPPQVWIMEIAAAATRPVVFSGIEYIRVGSAKKKLKDYPELERSLWRAFEREVFEASQALDGLTDVEVLDLIDYVGYFRLVKVAVPEGRAGVLHQLQHAGLIDRVSVGWSISNLGAALFGVDLRRFPSLLRKTVRVVQYDGPGRTQTIREREFTPGYAVGFEGVVDYVNTLLPRREAIGKSLRQEIPVYPEIVLRELVTNMLIHQDFTESGTGPMIEIFDTRIEITNPGRPVIDVNRFVDLPPKSRNEKLARMMRQAHLAEERGTGWDKIVDAAEISGLPAPRIDVTDFHTRVVVFGPKRLAGMDREDRLWSVYLHSVLRYVRDEATTNASVRQRFGIDEKNKALATRVLKEATEAKVIAVYDPSAGPRARRYVPFWAPVAS